MPELGQVLHCRRKAAAHAGNDHAIFLGTGGNGRFLLRLSAKPADELIDGFISVEVLGRQGREEHRDVFGEFHEGDGSKALIG